MAKQKAEPIFEEPEFDEREYLEGEKERAKTLVITFMIGAIIGLFSGYIYILGYGYLDILLIIVFLVFLKQILNALKLTLPKRTWHWILVGGEFLLTIIIFWTIFINPPITTVSNIQVSGLQYQNNGQWVSPPSSNGQYQLSPAQSDFSFRVYVNYISPITNISLSSSALINSSYSSSSHYEYFNVTLPPFGSSVTVTLTANASGRSITENFILTRIS
ncbi:MAG: hypothetical protein QW597_02680 [Thermoplasmataceae archaeon]